VLAAGVPEGMLVNVNFPACPAAMTTGFAVTRQGRRDSELIQLEQRHDGRGIPYYWLKFKRGGMEAEVGSDIEALAARKVSITPLSLNLTDEATRARYAALFASD